MSTSIRSAPRILISVVFYNLLAISFISTNFWGVGTYCPVSALDLILQIIKIAFGIMIVAYAVLCDYIILSTHKKTEEQDK